MIAAVAARKAATGCRRRGLLEGSAPGGGALSRRWPFRPGDGVCRDRRLHPRVHAPLAECTIVGSITYKTPRRRRHVHSQSAWIGPTQSRSHITAKNERAQPSFRAWQFHGCRSRFNGNGAQRSANHAEHHHFAGRIDTNAVGEPCRREHNEFNLVLDTFPAGIVIPRHHHPSTGLNYVLEGVAESQYEGEPLRHLAAGDSFEDHAHIPHLMFRNPDPAKPVRILISYTVKRGMPFLIIP